MNNKHRRFVDEYLIDQNATKAAGYSPKTAKSQGSHLLTHADISYAIAQGQNRISKELQITAQDKRAVLWSIATFNKTIEDQHGEQRMRDPKAATRAIAELNKMDGTYRHNESNQTHITFIQNFGDTDDDDRTVLTVMPPDD